MGLETTMGLRPDGPDEGYRIVQYPHGDAIYGMVPVADLEGLQKTWEAKGYTIWDIQVTSVLGATICATSAEGSKAWRAEVEGQAERIAGEDRELRWALGLDTGRSTALLMDVLGSSAAAVARASRIIYGGGSRAWGEDAIPRDADDLGRCVRLLDLFPAWREHLGRVADLFPQWAPLVQSWAQLEALYREELPSGAFPRTDGLLRALAEEASPVSESTVDLVGLSHEPSEGHPDGPYLTAVDQLCDVMLWQNTGLPGRLYLKMPPAPGATLLLWSRDGEDASMERLARRNAERDLAERDLEERDLEERVRVLERKYLPEGGVD